MSERPRAGDPTSFSHRLDQTDQQLRLGSLVRIEAQLDERRRWWLVAPGHGSESYLTQHRAELTWGGHERSCSSSLARGPDLKKCTTKYRPSI
jgi:hypothetical protein